MQTKRKTRKISTRKIYKTRILCKNILFCIKIYIKVKYGTIVCMLKFVASCESVATVYHHLQTIPTNGHSIDSSPKCETQIVKDFSVFSSPQSSLAQKVKLVVRPRKPIFFPLSFETTHAVNVALLSVKGTPWWARVKVGEKKGTQ